MRLKHIILVDKLKYFVRTEVRGSGGGMVIPGGWLSWVAAFICGGSLHRVANLNPISNSYVKFENIFNDKSNFGIKKSKTN